MVNIANKLRVIFGDSTIGIKGEGFHYIFTFDKVSGLESLSKNGKEWIYRAPRPTFWRATTDNDRGNKFSYRSQMWLGADFFARVIDHHILADGVQVVRPLAMVNGKPINEQLLETIAITFVYETGTVPNTTVDITYTVTLNGTINVNMKYYGKVGLPQLPVLGIRFIMPTMATGFRYEGLSGETYPDRMAGGVPDVYSTKGLPVTPYMLPQDCGVHMATKWVEITRNTTRSNVNRSNDEFSLRFEQDKEKFAFTCLPYTAAELESATHHEELPPPRFTVLTMLAKVRGVGGIDSWGADVEEAYHIDGEQNYEFSFLIK